MSEQTKVFEEKMKKSVSNLNSELLTIRAGRANPHVLDKVTVEYYGAEVPINQVASVSTPEARIIAISPFDSMFGWDSLGLRVQVYGWNVKSETAGVLNPCKIQLF